MKFELDRLISYSEEEIISEIRRVAKIVVGKPHMTRSDFDKHSKVNSSTVIRRFGGWREALIVAGFPEKYSGRTVNEKMRAQLARSLSDQEIIIEIKRIGEIISPRPVTGESIKIHSSIITNEVVARRFGSFKEGIKAAGLVASRLGNRYTEEDYFENMLTVWTHYGRAPKHGEMDKPPSRITSGAYEQRFKKWSLARLAFVEKMNSEEEGNEILSIEEKLSEIPIDSNKAIENNIEQRKVRLSLRYAVLVRDNFRCVICGRSPAVNIGCELHVDHIIPLARGGKNENTNLRSLCAECNLGKGSTLENSAT